MQRPTRTSDLTLRYGSSLRAASVVETLERARQVGVKLGITRVTEITRLDRPGIPVCVSIRPDALPGSLCVNAGKGVTPEEARVGAWMEAIEYALAEPGASFVPTVEATARDVLDGRARPDAILDLCPILGTEIPLDAPLACVEVEEILSQTSCCVPAELVFLPTPPHLPGVGWFGSSSGGLASGNTLLEATVHGLAEVIEHDIRAFCLLADTSVPVREESFPDPALALALAIRAANLSLEVTYQPNVFGLPFFNATIRDRESDSPLFRNGGYGCHPHRSIALVRALCEAAQSRLSFIHGGRDDLTDWEQLAKSPPHASEPGAAHTTPGGGNAGNAATDRTRREAIDFRTIPDYAASAATLESCFETLRRSLRAAGFERICRVAFTAALDPVQVVRVLVPGLESFGCFLPRVGRRLSEFAEHL